MLIDVHKSLFSADHDVLPLPLPALEGFDDTTIVAHVARTFDDQFVGRSRWLRVFSTNEGY